MAKTHIFADNDLAINAGTTPDDVRAWLNRTVFCGRGKDAAPTAINERFVKKFRRRDYCQVCLGIYRKRHERPGKVLKFRGGGAAGG